MQLPSSKQAKEVTEFFMQYEVRLLNHSHKTLWMRKVYKAKINHIMLSIRDWEILGFGRNSLLFVVSFYDFCSSHVLEQVPSWFEI